MSPASRVEIRRPGYSVRYVKVGGRWCDHARCGIRAEQWRAMGRV
ncbi:MAG TPA: hypothetical protein VKS25_14190 [Solirubrobacteraceae bacterium]|nr:hypothetical protein [Solirubrobacteraceae bacterium]